MLGPISRGALAPVDPPKTVASAKRLMSATLIPNYETNLKYLKIPTFMAGFYPSVLEWER